MIKIKTALISVSDKSGIVEFAKFLAENGVKIISTGGTAKAIAEANVEVSDISEVTGFPEIMDGRVKTLHPKVHGGLLAVRDNAEHINAMEMHQIKEIDMVIVNLYPFEETVKRGAGFDETIENIDIGGPSMIRSAAKNHKFVTVITDPEDYKRLESEMAINEMHISRELSEAMAAKAFARTASYDTAIADWFAGSSPEVDFEVKGKLKQTLRYGENPHQQASFYVSNDLPGVANAEQLQGKELSYNNINDTDAAWQLVNEFEEPAVAIIKHANPCGVAVADNLKDAYMKAFEADSTSAFGGIIALNGKIDKATAEEIVKIFTEVIIAPSVDSDALEVFAKKKNLRVLVTGRLQGTVIGRSVKSVAGGLLVQDIDNATVRADELEIVTDVKPNDQQIADMIFAYKVVKHVKSNAIVAVKDGVTTGIGAGQMNRVGSVKLACSGDVEGHVLASDAFFPFADNVDFAKMAGIAAIIQPGGSMRDDEVVQASNKAGIPMAFTGKRVFKH